MADVDVEDILENDRAFIQRFGDKVGRAAGHAHAAFPRLAVGGCAGEVGQDRRVIAVHFKPVPHLAFTERPRPRANVLRLELNPDRMALGVNINGLGDPFELDYVDLDVALAPQEISPYGRLLLDVLAGDLTLSIRNDEAEESWRIVEPVLRAWAAGQLPLVEYAAGSQGPGQFNPLMSRH